jgi:hypothetical protein
LARAESPRERGQAQLGAGGAAHENEYMSQCLFARSAVAGNAGAARSSQEYKSAQPARSNPSIERTSKRLRLFAAAHVERYATAQPRVNYRSSFRLRSAGSQRHRRTVARRRRVHARTHGLSRVRGAVFFLRSRQAPIGAKMHWQRSESRLFLTYQCAVNQRRCRLLSCTRRRDARHSQAGVAARRLRVVASHNPTVERTNNGGPRLAVQPAVCAPLIAAHLRR